LNLEDRDSLDINQLKQLLDLVKEHDLAEFEVEHDGLHLRVRKNAGGSLAVTSTAPHAAALGALSAPAAAPAPAVAAAPVAAPEAAADSEIELAIVKSPIVGTFYRSSEPGAASFVEVGSTVKKGDVLCIIEAMKLMNEIDSEYDGEVTNVYVENGQPVQYGERLFAIRTR
jgi:acetyl-CoA carboxylase biotin carboxyl carrier protein